MPIGKDPWNFRSVVEDGMGLSAIRGIWGEHPILDYLLDRVRGRLELMCVPDFYEWDEDEIRERLARRFGATFERPHSDCLGAGTMEWVWYQRYGFGAPTARLSQAIRMNRIGRDEALKLVSRLEPPGLPPSLQQVAEAAGVTVDEILAGAQRDQGRYHRSLLHRAAEFYRNWYLGR